MYWYQINPDYFGEISQKKNFPGSNEKISFYKLVEKNIDRIKELHFDGIWLMPLFIRGEKHENGKGSPYAVKEFVIDPVFGTEEELIHLVKTAHEKGLKVLSEYIPNHMSHYAPFVLENPDVTYKDDKGNFLYDQTWGDTVKLNHKNPKVIKFIQDNIIRLLKTYDFDGLRLDMSHYLYYDINSTIRFENDTWRDIFDNEFFKTKDFIFFGEVYDDRNQDAHGYGDQIRLLSNDIAPYDKKTFDILAKKFAGTLIDGVERVFSQELTYQGEAIEASKNNHFKIIPFLRFSSNHDDSPGIKNFGGINEFALATELLAFLPGHCMLYAGDEYGFAVKPSVTGINVQDANGTLWESEHIYFLEQKAQDYIFSRVSKAAKIRQEYKIYEKDILMSELKDNDGNPSADFLSFAYIISEHEMLIIAGNLSHDPGQKWMKIENLFPKYQIDAGSSSFKDFLSKMTIERYRVIDIYNNTDLGIRHIDDEFWIALDSMQLQVLKVCKL